MRHVPFADCVLMWQMDIGGEEDADQLWHQHDSQDLLVLLQYNLREYPLVSQLRDQLVDLLLQDQPKHLELIPMKVMMISLEYITIGKMMIV